MSGISLSRVTVAFALVLALVLSAIPAQALPRDPGSRLSTLDVSLFEAALGWLHGILDGGSDSESLQSMTAGAKGSSKGLGRPVPMSGSCVDPFGQPIVPCPDNP